MFRDRLAKIGFILPFCAGAGLLKLTLGTHDGLRPLILFLFIVSFANLKPQSWLRPLILLGDASYSVYLIHPLVFMIGSAVVSKLLWLPLWCEEPIRFACIAIAIAASFASLKWIERPTIALGNKLTSFKSAAAQEVADPQIIRMM
jgi:peptidoglycan/LPS O-acetylase OafA/YrhL